MYKINVEDMFSGKSSRYALVIAVAKRAREITEEFEEKGVISDDKPVLLAIDEFENNKYSILASEEEDEQ